LSALASWRSSRSRLNLRRGAGRRLISPSQVKARAGTSGAGALFVVWCA
jgi:hypothetical protein